MLFRILFGLLIIGGLYMTHKTGDIDPDHVPLMAAVVLFLSVIILVIIHVFGL